MNIVLLFIVAITIVIFILVWLNFLGGKVDKYFYKAVQAWLLKNDNNAKVAAMSAAKTASPAKQKDFVGKLLVIHFSLVTLEPKKSIYIKRAKLLKELIDEIKSKIWNVKDATIQRDILYALDPEYALALNKFNSEIFQERYPELKSQKIRNRFQKLHVELLDALTERQLR